MQPYLPRSFFPSRYLVCWQVEARLRTVRLYFAPKM